MTVEEMLEQAVDGALVQWHTAEELEHAAERIEELRTALPSDELLLAMVHAFFERMPAALRAAANALAQEPRP